MNILIIFTLCFSIPCFEFGAFLASDNILDENIYDARIRPASMNSSDGPTNIKVNLMLRSIDKIDDVKMEFSTQITFRLN